MNKNSRIHLERILKTENLYMFSAFIYLVSLFILVINSLNINQVISTILFLPTFFVILLCLIVTPIFLSKEQTLFKYKLEQFYIFTSLWFLINIISIIISMRWLN